MKARKLLNILALSLLPILGCKATPCEKRIEMFEHGKHLENWPWINNPEEYLNNRRFNEIRKVLWYNCVLFRYKENDGHFLGPITAAYLRDEYKKDSE